MSWPGVPAGTDLAGPGDADVRAVGALAGVMIVGGGLVAAVNSAAPFEHGSWLAAYLVLVAGAAQRALIAGAAAPPAPGPPGRFLHVQLLLWNGGNAGVMTGVLAGVPVLVTAGSVALLVALAHFAVAAAGPRVAGPSVGLLLYRTLLAGLAASVVIGMALAGAPPLSWA